MKTLRGVTPAALVGLAIGDALGMPFEKLDLQHPAYLWWDGGYIDSVIRPPPYGHGLKAGQFTDDTQMALALADSILRCRKYDHLDVLKSYIEWYAGSPRGIGGTIKRALRDAQEELRRNGSISAHPVSSASVKGNGVVMRLAPLSIWLVGQIQCGGLNPAEADQTISRETGLTHHGPQSRYTAQVLHIALASAHSTKTKAEFGAFVNPCSLHPGEPCTDIVTVNRAIACFLNTETFAAAVQMAVRLGDDTDTVAAITGAIAGAWYGMDGIPESYLMGLEEADRIINTQTRLYDLSTTKKASPC